MKKLAPVALILSLTLACAASEYRLLKQIPIGGEGWWDYLSVDPAAHRLYLAHATRIVVVNLDKDQVIGEIADTPGVHGFAIGERFGFSSNGAENKVSVVDLNSLKTISKIATQENPDAILYEPKRGEVYAFNGKSHSVTVIDAKSASVTATIPLGGKPEFAVADAESGRVFCNIQDKSEIAVIDAQAHKVIARWPLAPGQEPTGLAYDAAQHRLFSACSNKLLVMLDSTTGKLLSSAAIGAGVDACAFDAANGNVFASCGDGTVTIAKADGEELNVSQTLQSERGARTMALDPTTHRIYLATAKFDPEKKDERGRPGMVSGTFHLLEFGLK